MNNKNLKINWFVNLNQSTNLNPSNLFFGNQIVNDQNKIVVSSNQFTFIDGAYKEWYPGVLKHEGMFVNGQ